MDVLLAAFSLERSLVEWWDQYVLAIGRLNPSLAVQAVIDVSNAKDFFHVSFQAYYASKLWVDRNLLIFEAILTHKTTPVVLPILNLVEYMDLAATPLPLSLVSISRAAERSGLWAKALYFREIEFRESSVSECIESLIASNIKLGYTESVHGLLRSEPVVEFIRVRPSWHEKLHNWAAALNAYTVRLLHANNDAALQEGRMQCLAELGEWKRLFAACSGEKGPYFFAAACFHTQQWGKIPEEIPQCSSQSYVYLAAGAIFRKQFEKAQKIISEAEKNLPSNLHRIQLVQLEEIMDYCGDADSIKARWETRLQELEYSVEVWRLLVPMRALLFCPFTEDIDVWVRFSTVARKKDSLTLSDRIVEMLEADPRSANHHGVLLARIKILYAAGRIADAANRLDVFLKQTCSLPAPLLAKCHLALGLWLPHMDMRIPGLLAKSVQLDPQSYKSRSALALLQFKDLRADSVPAVVVSTVRSLFQCIALAPAAPLQDVLRIITLWFRWYDSNSEPIQAEFESGFKAVPLKTWLQAIPQILARLRGPISPLRTSIANLMTQVGAAYPQSLVFPLATSSSEACQEVLRSLEPKLLVEETQLVCAQLVRISISWAEHWTAVLEEASRLYFVDQNLPAMTRVLDRAHAALSVGVSAQEGRFLREYGSDLKTAKSWIDRAAGLPNCDACFYLETGWQYYYRVFQRLHAPLATSFELESVSPELATARNLSLWVPGTTVRMHALDSQVEILSSKQKPRIVRIVGEDARMYQFLLKGNEDLKQDERIMQLFRLINAVVADAATSRRRSGVLFSTPGVETLATVHLRTFSVVPLASNAGLIEWVPGCETLHGIIKARRNTCDVPLSIEHNIMRNVYPKYEELPLLQRIQIFQTTMHQTSGDELRRSMWLASGGCERWLRQRAVFARSLAVTSIVGFILGLGDRHPSNLMIERNTGQVIHIDFGDCFDVAAKRDRFPEKIPFRLTRQLINALDVGGVDGTFRITAERMLDLMRKNIDTILAMLEAFVNDPLLGHPDDLVDCVHAKLSADDYIVQVQRLIHEATAPENLCQCYLGWCPFW